MGNTAAVMGEIRKEPHETPKDEKNWVDRSRRRRTDEEWFQYMKSYSKRMHHSHKCMQCYASFKETAALLNHLGTYHIPTKSGSTNTTPRKPTNEDGIPECTRCKKRFTSHRTLKIHQQKPCIVNTLSKPFVLTAGQKRQKMKPVVVGMKMKPQGVLKTKKGINVLENKTSPAGKRVKMSSPSSVKGAKSQAEIDKEIKKETIKAASSCVRQFSSPISSFVEPAIIQTLPTGPKTLNVTKPTGAKISNGTGGVKTLNIRTGDKSINVTVKPVKTRVGRTIIPSERAISASITRAIVEAEPKYIDHIEFMKKEKGNKKVAKKVKIEQSKDPPQVEATEPAITEFKLVKKLKVEPEIKLIDTGKVAAANNDSKPLPKSKWIAVNGVPQTANSTAKPSIAPIKVNPIANNITPVKTDSPMLTPVKADSTMVALSNGASNSFPQGLVNRDGKSYLVLKVTPIVNQVTNSSPRYKAIQPRPQPGMALPNVTPPTFGCNLQKQGAAKATVKSPEEIFDKSPIRAVKTYTKVKKRPPTP